MTPAHRFGEKLEKWIARLESIWLCVCNHWRSLGKRVNFDKSNTCEKVWDGNVLLNSNELSERYPNQNGPPPSEPEYLSPAAERMRRHRERRRQGLRCLIIELRETEIDALVGMKLLRAEMRNDPSAVSKALYAYFDRTLDFTP